MEKPILFFDGICGLCNRAVNHVLKYDVKTTVLVSPLQGKTAERMLKPEHRDNLDSLILFYGNEVLIKSDAFFKLLDLIKSPWRGLRIFRILPKFLLDFIYDLVAKNRYRIFGKRKSCRLPSAAELNHFLE